MLSRFVLFIFLFALFTTAASAQRNFANASNHAFSTEVQEAWVSDFDNNLFVRDFATAMVVDAFGNVIVTGSSEGDYLTIKYDPTGHPLWTARYNGDGDGNDEATAITIDNAGNVYITGTSFGGNSNSLFDDYATIKYDSFGVEQWVRRFHWQGNIGGSYGSDMAKAIAVDLAGNVYVTGISYDSTSRNDYATIRYTSSGVEQWVSRYNGPGNGWDQANAIALDQAGNIYITGRSEGNSTSWDYATIKYTPSGVEEWVSRYNGPGNGRDQANAIALDIFGNTCVTGVSQGSGTGYDYATIKYNSFGIEEWVSRYNGPGDSRDGANALTLDGTGNVYVTGWSGSSGTRDDYATIKYNAFGDEQWVSRYNGPGNVTDVAKAIALDDFYNVYVTGLSWGKLSRRDYATIKYDSSGVEKWVARYDGPESSWDDANTISLDGTGNTYVTGVSRGGDTGDDYATIKYDDSGNEIWVARYDGPGNDERAPVLALDDFGNALVTGKSNNGLTTIKYDPSSGAEQWIVNFRGTLASDIVTDDAGNVYITGESFQAYATVKYDALGNRIWDVSYRGTARAITVDKSGNVYITGRSQGDFATIKYDSLGNELWVALYNGPGNFGEDAYDIAVDDSGNVFVTGTSFGATGSFDYATVKYDSSGNELWVSRYNGPSNGFDGENSLTIDAAGNVYITGWSRGNQGPDSTKLFDYATIKYASDGSELWAARYNGPAQGNDMAEAIAVDDSGNVYVTGRSEGVNSSGDYATIKYDSSGNQIWINRYNGAGNGNDAATALALDDVGDVYVTGFSIGAGTFEDYTTIKYSSSGTQQWQIDYDGPDDSFDFASAVAVDAAGNVFVTGYSDGDGRSVYTTIKYEQTGVCISDGDINGNGSLTPQDALCAFGVFLNSQTLPADPDCDAPDSDCEAIAANVNCDSLVTPADALAIFQHFFDNGEPEACFAQTSLARSNYQVGELSLSLQQNTAKETALSGGRDTLRVSLVVDRSGGLQAFGFTLSYPMEKLNFIDIKPTALTQDWQQLNGQSNSPGQITIGGFHDMPLHDTGNSEILHVLFVENSQNVTRAEFKISAPLDDFKNALVSNGGSAAGDAPAPTTFALQQNYPNPFNPATKIKYNLPTAGQVNLTVYNLMGQQIRSLVNALQSSGEHQVTWDAKNDAGNKAESGIYFYRIEISSGSGQRFVQTQKAIFMK